MEECLKVYSERISSEHPHLSGKVSEGLGGNIGCRDKKNSSWYQKCITFVYVIATAVVPVALYSNMGVALRQFVLY